MSFTTFEEIEAWQNARELMKIIRIVCRKPEAKHEYGWIDQITRATLSIMANIAEGNDCQTNAEFVMFLGYAKRSSTEVRSHLYYALDEKLLTNTEFEQISTLAKKISAQLAKIIQYLTSPKQKGKLHTISTSNSQQANQQQNATL